MLFWLVGALGSPFCPGAKGIPLSLSCHDCWTAVCETLIFITQDTMCPTSLAPTNTHGVIFYILFSAVIVWYNFFFYMSFLGIFDICGNAIRQLDMVSYFLWILFFCLPTRILYLSFYDFYTCLWVHWYFSWFAAKNESIECYHLYYCAYYLQHFHLGFFTVPIFLWHYLFCGMCFQKLPFLC